MEDEEGDTKFALVEDKDIKKEIGDDPTAKKKLAELLLLLVAY